jgi:Toprim-like/DNA primase catalytic core, N-terminal domain
MAEMNSQTRIVDYYTDVVLPALAERLDVAFPEFGWRRDSRGWVATNEEMTHRVLGVRAERVVAHGPAPRGFLIHGGDPVLWTAYMNGGHVPHGADFVRTVRELAERAGVDTGPLERREPRDPKAELLGRFFELAQRELASERGARAREYLESRGLPRDAIETSGVGVVPSSDRTRSELRRAGFADHDIETSGLVADRRWPRRICGAWRDERGQIRTLWARAVDGAHDPDSKYLYLRGASRTGLPPYGFSEVVARPFAERGDLVLVEGLPDVHHFRARGISNVVALGGTSTQPETFERLTRFGFERVTICLDRDGPGRVATARVIEQAVRTTRSPSLLVVEPEELAPAKDPDAFLRDRGTDAWLELLAKRECGIVWRARELLGAVTPESPSLARRDGLRRAGAWLGALPPSLALEQDDAIRLVAEWCGYDAETVARAFRGRFWSPSRETLEIRCHAAEPGRGL